VSIGRIFLFVAGASVAFAAVNAVVTRGFRTRVQTEPPVVLAVATSLSVVSSSAAVGVAVLLGFTLGDWLAWLLTSLLSTWVYLSVAALEMAMAPPCTSTSVTKTRNNGDTEKQDNTRL
jgi:hypothetical protein